MNRDGMSFVAWTEAYFMRKKYGDGDRSQHELRCVARVLEVALLYDQPNVRRWQSFELLCRRAPHDAQHPQYAGSEFEMDGDAWGPMLQQKVTEAVKSRTKPWPGSRRPR